MDLCPSPRQQELIDLAHRLAVDNFAPRASTESSIDARAELCVDGGQRSAIVVEPKARGTVSVGGQLVATIPCS